MDKEAIEKIAELEHAQWMAWSTNIAEKEQLREERLKRWQEFWVEYKDLPEEIKEEDRKWARLVLELIGLLGYRKLPKAKPPLVENPWKRHIDVQQGFDGGSQTQREADIKFYEGK